MAKAGIKKREAEVMEYLSSELWEILGAVTEAHERCKGNVLLADSWIADFLSELAQRLHKAHHEAVVTEADLYLIPNWREYYGLESQ